MWRRSNQWERALLGRNFQLYNNWHYSGASWVWKSAYLCIQDCTYVHPIRVAGVKFCISSTPRGIYGHPDFKREKKSNRAQSFLEREIITCAARISKNFRFKDEDDYEYEIWLKRFLAYSQNIDKASFYHFSLEKLALLSLVKEVTPSPDRKKIKLLILFDDLFPPLRHSRYNS